MCGIIDDMRIKTALVAITVASFPFLTGCSSSGDVVLPSVAPIDIIQGTDGDVNTVETAPAVVPSPAVEQPAVNAGEPATPAVEGQPGGPDPRIELNTVIQTPQDNEAINKEWAAENPRVLQDNLPEQPPEGWPVGTVPPAGWYLEPNGINGLGQRQSTNPIVVGPGDNITIQIGDVITWSDPINGRSVGNYRKTGPLVGGAGIWSPIMNTFEANEGQPLTLIATATGTGKLWINGKTATINIEPKQPWDGK